MQLQFRNRTRILVLGTLVLAAIPLFSQDEQGSQDHPLISRFQGSTILVYDQKEYNAYQIPLGAVVEGKLSSSQKLEGKVTQITYAAPEGKSVLEVFSNYEAALNNAGFAVLLSAKKNELGDNWVGHFVGSTERAYRYGAPGLETRLEGDFQYLAAKLIRAEGDVYVALCVNFGWFQRFPVVQLDVIEIRPMDTGLVKVDADALAREIDRTGHASIYGIYFDTDKTDVKTESVGALAEIAKLLQMDPSLNLYVVGHTDNVGTLDYNMDLSKRRAEAVVRVLVSEYRIDANRLIPAGVGPLSPVLANKIEEGRARNRRVELVKH